MCFRLDLILHRLIRNHVIPRVSYLHTYRFFVTKTFISDKKSRGYYESGLTENIKLG